MDRRRFLGALVGGVAVGAAVRTWPFRVFSFPSEIVTPELNAACSGACREGYFASGPYSVIYTTGDPLLDARLLAINRTGFFERIKDASI